MCNPHRVAVVDPKHHRYSFERMPLAPSDGLKQAFESETRPG